MYIIYNIGIYKIQYNKIHIIITRYQGCEIILIYSYKLWWNATFKLITVLKMSNYKRIG